MYIIGLLFSIIFTHPEVTAIGLALMAIVSYVAYRRSQKGAVVTKYLIGLIICILLSVITTSKLYTMYQIRGWIKGAYSSTYRVRQKWDEYSWNRTSRRMEHTYWVSWTDQDIRQIGPHRLNLLYEKWSSLKVGDPIEITYVPRDPDPYVRNDIFDSDDNFIFDYMLLLAELSGVVWLTLRLSGIGIRKGKKQDSDIIRLFEQRDV